MQRLAAICIARPVFATMLILALVVVGAASWFRLGVDRFPAVDLPSVSVRTTLPGASPEEIETVIAQPIEEAVNTVEGIEELRSVSGPGTSFIIATFSLERDIDTAAQDVRDRLSGVLRRLPRDIDPPVVSKFNNENQPILTIALAADRPLRELSEIADRLIKRQLERSAGVGEVRLVGDVQRAINVWVDADRLAAYRIPITQVRDAVAAQNVDVPGGNVTGARREEVLRTMGRIADPAAFDDIVITTREGRPIRVRDVGRAEDGTREQRTVSRLDGVPTVQVQVLRQSGANTVGVIEAVKENLDRIRPQLPPDIRLELTRDQSRYIYAALHEINLHLVLGSILASLVVLAFMRSGRSTVIAAVAIPASVVSTFGMMWLLDFTLNSVTMLALVLMVGIVIDDAIVVLENIFRFVEEKRMTPFDAARAGTAEIGLAVLATTLSLVVIFVPVSFMSSVSGRFLYQFGLTAAVAVMVSLLVSFTLTPMMSARLLRGEDAARGHEAQGHEAQGHATQGHEAQRDAAKGHEAQGHATQGHEAQRDAAKAHGTGGAEAPRSRSGFYARLDRAYSGMLAWSVNHRVAIALISLAVVATSIPLYGLVRREYIPSNVDEAEFEITATAPEGTSLAAMDEAVRAIEGELRQMPVVRTMLCDAGGGFLGGVNQGGCFVRIAPHEERTFSIGRLARETVRLRPWRAFMGNQSQRDVMQQIGARLRKYTDLRVSVRNIASFNIGGPPFDIDFVLRGPDLEQLATYGEALRRRAPELGLEYADITLKLDKPELHAVIDRDRAADLGVRTGDIATALRLMVGGDTQVSRFLDPAANEEYDVQLRLSLEDRQDPGTIATLYVPSTKADLAGGLVRLDNVVSIDRARGVSRIDRLDRQRQVSLRAMVAPGYAQADRIEALREETERMNLPPAYSTAVSGRARELERTFREFVVAFVLSIIFMYMILAAQFESLAHPLTILLSLPLSVPFALFSLWATGNTLNLYSALGVLVLFGVVKKNAILQVDHMNKLREAGVPRHTAVMQGNRDRLRPILMTTLALVAGMLPLALGSGPGAEERRAVAVVVIGGQTLCLLLTLLVTPVAYLWFDDLAVRLGLGSRDRRAATASAPVESVRRDGEEPRVEAAP